MRSLEGDDAPVATNSYGDNNLRNTDNVPRHMNPRVERLAYLKQDVALLLGQSRRDTAIHQRCNKRTTNHQTQRHNRRLMLADKVQRNAILSCEHKSTHHQDKGQDLVFLEGVGRFSWFPGWSYDGEADHDAEMKGFGAPLEDAIGSEADVVEGV